jgi:hypothetical protein
VVTNIDGESANRTAENIALDVRNVGGAALRVDGGYLAV